MGMLAAYLYFFEPYYPEAFNHHVIDSIFRMFPAHHDPDQGWMAHRSYYESRRV